MDVWIETVARTLVKGSCATHISMRHTDTSGWEVSISASAAPAPFATGLKDKDAARNVRNTLALSMSTASAAKTPQVIVYDDQELSVSCYALSV